jgi:hypothetical protein
MIQEKEPKEGARSEIFIGYVENIWECEAFMDGA